MACALYKDNNRTGKVLVRVQHETQLSQLSPLSRGLSCGNVYAVRCHKPILCFVVCSALCNLDISMGALDTANSTATLLLSTTLYKPALRRPGLRQASQCL